MDFNEYQEQSKTKGVTFIEVLIMVAIIGILTARVFPAFQDNIRQAKESSAQDNLCILRNVIGYYASQDDGIGSGYPSDDPDNEPVGPTFLVQLVVNNHYMTNMPKNPFNDLHQVKMIKNTSNFPVRN